MTSQTDESQFTPYTLLALLPLLLWVALPNSLLGISYADHFFDSPLFIGNLILVLVPFLLYGPALGIEKDGPHFKFAMAIFLSGLLLAAYMKHIGASPTAFRPDPVSFGVALLASNISISALAIAAKRLGVTVVSNVVVLSSWGAYGVLQLSGEGAEVLLLVVPTLPSVSAGPSFPYLLWALGLVSLFITDHQARRILLWKRLRERA